MRRDRLDPLTPKGVLFSPGAQHVLWVDGDGRERAWEETSEILTAFPPRTDVRTGAPGTFMVRKSSTFAILDGSGGWVAGNARTPSQHVFETFREHALTPAVLDF